MEPKRHYVFNNQKFFQNKIASFPTKQSKNSKHTLIAITPVLIALNIILGELTVFLKIPLYLDSIGTILMGILAGPFWAMLVGAGSYLTWGILLDPIALSFTPVAIAIGLASGLGRKMFLGSMWRLLTMIIIVSLVGLVTAAPICAYLFNGITASGSSLIIAYLVAKGTPVFTATLLSGLILDTLDKIVCCLVALELFKRMPKKFINNI